MTPHNTARPAYTSGQRDNVSQHQTPSAVRYCVHSPLGSAHIPAPPTPFLDPLITNRPVVDVGNMLPSSLTLSMATDDPLRQNDTRTRQARSDAHYLAIVPPNLSAALTPKTGRQRAC